MARPSLTRFAWLSVIVAVAILGLKLAAYAITGSVGLLSDAVESLVNLAGGLMALAMLAIAARPADEDHAYGHHKAEYFSSGVEGGLILVAAVGIAVAASRRLFVPQPLEDIGEGLLVSCVASLLNLGTAVVLLRAGRRHNSVTLEANARHLLTDVWTSAGVIVGVGLVALTDLYWLDPVVALLVAANIVRTGLSIMRGAVSGLMDTALPEADLRCVRRILEGYQADGVRFHALQSRQAGAHKFVSLHVLVPGDWTVQRGHAVAERIEADIRHALSDSTVFTHLESLDDPASWEEQPPEQRHKSGGSAGQQD